MWKFLTVVALMAPLAAHGAPLSEADKASLAGEWRTGACDAAGPRMTLEFAVTGGQMLLEASKSARLMLRVQSTDAEGSSVTVTFQDKSSWTFARSDPATLVSVTPPMRAPELKDFVFKRCRAPLDRGVLKLAPDAISFFSVTMPPEFPTFIDAAEKDGCRARGYRYLSIDLVGPEEFALTRGTLVPAGKDGRPRLADTATWSIDAADELPNVVRLTITPLTGPAGIRGTAERISLVAGEDSGLLTVPEWGAVYRRCPVRALAGNGGG
ncbi:MAG: hypothetical protein ACREHE_00565 [Rhizomicrobium sp.]